jgi:HEAT repeat protein
MKSRQVDPGPSDLALRVSKRSHLAEVMTSAFCAKCHPSMYAEHQQNTHGRAFTDHEPRLATGRFAHSDCINCHTPRPIFETGVGMNPLRRHHNLEDGNSCMTCHWRPDIDYGSFEGGAECKTAFHPDVGTVNACASCHRNHGTPYQWEKSKYAANGTQTCMTCHMKKIRRPVAIGEAPRLVRSHVFPGSRNEEQLRRAYTYETRIEDNEVVVKITNSGAGHNFPTELKQRSLESLVIIKDKAGNELYRSRMIFRDPYKRPYGLHLPVNTQIPAGEHREHRVPIRVPNGTAQTELHFKLYYPIEDHHPELTRQLELRQIPFDGVQPSTKPVETSPEPKVVMPEGTNIKNVSAAQLVDFSRPEIGKTEVDIPQGSTPADIRALIELFMFPVPQAQKDARQRLLEIGDSAIPALVEALGSWDNKTWKNASSVLFQMGDRVRPHLRKASNGKSLYARVFARTLLADLGRPVHTELVTKALLTGLSMDNPSDRISAADALGRLEIQAAATPLRALLTDTAPDVVRSTALALALLNNKAAIAPIRIALANADYVETRRDLAKALAMLGCVDGIPLLIEGLDHRDDLIREHFFEALFAVTGLHKGYDALAPRPQRLEAIARVSAYWTKQGSAELLRRPWPPSKKAHNRAWGLVQKLADKPDQPERDQQLLQDLVNMGEEAIPAMILGLKYPAGFFSKRFHLLDGLAALAQKRSAPFVAAALRDPVVVVASRACLALARIKDPDTLPAMRYYHSDLLSKQAKGSLPANAGHPDHLIAQSASTRLVLGDAAARYELINYLLSDNREARQTAHQALVDVFGDKFAYDPDGPVATRRTAARQWLNDRGSK